MLGLAAVYSSVRYISDAIAALPIKVYRMLPDGTVQRVWSSSLLGNPIAGGGPQISGTMYDWIFSGSTSALLWGNAWGYITNRSGIPGPDGNGLPTGIAWLPPERMSVTDDEQQPENPLRAKIYYNGRLMEQSDLVHMRAFSVPGKVEGISPLRAFTQLWQQGLDAVKYSADWFENGGFPPGTFQNLAEEVDEAQSKEIRRRLTDAIRMRQPLVYGRDWEYKAIAVPPNEAAFIEAMQLNATQVAAIFGLPPDKVGGKRGDSLTYNTVVQSQLELITDTLRPWLVRWEHLLTGLLPSTQYAKFDADALLKTDPKTRTEIYQIQRQIGTRTQNEIRLEDDKPPLIGGDDAIPLGVLERMVATTRAIPKSLLPLITLEADHMVEVLEELQAKGLTAQEDPGKPAISLTPPQYLGRMMTQARKLIMESERRGKIDNMESNARLHALSQVDSVSTVMELIKDLPALNETVSGGAAGRSGDSWRDKLTRHGDWRASNEDRKTAERQLKAHAATGRMNDIELAERIRVASSAVFLRDLGKLFEDLPAELPAEPQPEALPSEEPPQPIFGQAALITLHERAMRFDQERITELAGAVPLNGKAH